MPEKLHLPNLNTQQSFTAVEAIME